MRGPCDALHQAWLDAFAWIAEQGLSLTGMPHEAHRIDHSMVTSPEELETDLVTPVS